jgi:DNA-binding MarR family transcriptional regulator/GNAT superfamily N-acetyltransferase
MPAKPTDAEVEALREFNRVYARHLDALSAGAASSALSVGEARVLREIAVRERTTAREVSQALSLDPGYLSRMLQDFQRRGLLWKEVSPTDRRAQLISLTRAGAQAFARLDAYTREQAAHLLRDLPADERRRLVGATRILSRWVSGAPEPRGGTTVRGHAPGDMGWVLERHGALFHREFGWDERFEALVALNVGRFLRERENDRERCWIAERDGERVGCVLLVRDPDRFGVAKLQLLLVEPHARGRGVGARLLNETTRFARKAGYTSIRLWTADVLEAARHLFEQAGYRLLNEAPFSGYGPQVRGQIWELEL